MRTPFVGLEDGTQIYTVNLGNERSNELCQAYRQSLQYHGDATYVNMGTTYGSLAE